MKQTFSLLLVIALVISSVTEALAQKQVTKNEAQNAAIHTIQSYYPQKKYDQNAIIKINVNTDRAKTLLYEVVFLDGSAVLLSGSKATLPILGVYHVEQSQSLLNEEEDIPDALKDLLIEYITQISYTFDNDSITLSFSKEWESLQQEKSRGICYEVVSPLLSSAWGQSKDNFGDLYGYNYYVIETNTTCLENGHKCPAGCAAVAMAQIMNYWECPVYRAILNKTH